MGFTDGLSKQDLIESVYEKGGYGMIIDKRYEWIDEDDLICEFIDVFDEEDIGDYAFDFKDGQYKVLKFDILYHNNLRSYYHFELGKDWLV